MSENLDAEVTALAAHPFIAALAVDTYARGLDPREPEYIDGLARFTRSHGVDFTDDTVPGRAVARIIDTHRLGSAPERGMVDALGLREVVRLTLERYGRPVWRSEVHNGYNIGALRSIFEAVDHAYGALGPRDPIAVAQALDQLAAA